MTMPERQSFLPKVEEADLLDLVLEDVLDPKHIERWRHFTSTQSLLAREILKKTFTETRQARADTTSALAQQKLILDTLTFAFSALERAGERASLLAVDDEDQALSA